MCSQKIKKNLLIKEKRLIKKGSSDKEESADKEESLDLSDIPPLEGDKEEIREGKGIKNLTSNKLLAKLPTLLAEIKAGNNSYKK